MKATRVVISDQEPSIYSGAIIVYFVAENGKKTPWCDPQIKELVAELFSLGDFVGKKETKLITYTRHSSLCTTYRAKRILLVGLGELTDDPTDNEIREIMRCAGGTVASVAKDTKSETIGVVFPDFYDKINAGNIEQLCEGILLGDYSFEKYKKTEEGQKPFPGIKRLTIISGKHKKIAKQGITAAATASNAVKTARNMAHEPGNKWTPQHFADFAKQLAEDRDISCIILEKNDMEELRMGGILAVNQGSSTPPKVIIMEYAPEQPTGTILLVGKGITFDSGGISLKPAAGMQDMKYDMCGGAAVLAVMDAVTTERPSVRVVAIVPSTDNMAGDSALKPGDIITHYNGTTSEVVNTDAEGRLILADALAYGIKKFNPDCVIDLATLTGAIIVALGHHRTGLFCNHDKLSAIIEQCGEYSGEPLWRMPLGPEYKKQIESDVADIKNTGGKEAGASTAAVYLETFVGKTPWAHLDIAGTAWDFTKKPYIPKGPSGTGVRTLLSFIRAWQKRPW